MLACIYKSNIIGALRSFLIILSMVLLRNQHVQSLYGYIFVSAFDMTLDYEKALEDIVNLGCERILTSGQDVSALEGTEIIKKCIDLVSL